MTYEELYNAVCAELPAHVNFCVEVETWKRRNERPDTTWKIYVSRPWSALRVPGGRDGVFFEGHSAQSAWDAFASSLAAEPLGETSASVGAVGEDLS